jgi:hypothetical protein
MQCGVAWQHSPNELWRWLARDCRFYVLPSTKTPSFGLFATFSADGEKGHCFLRETLFPRQASIKKQRSRKGFQCRETEGLAPFCCV